MAEEAVDGKCSGRCGLLGVTTIPLGNDGGVSHVFREGRGGRGRSRGIRASGWLSNVMGMVGESVSGDMDDERGGMMVSGSCKTG